MVAGRGKTIAIALGWSVLFFLLGMVLSIAFVYAIALATGLAESIQGVSPALDKGGASVLLVTGIAQALGFGLATWLVGVRINRLTAVDLRWRAVQPRLAGFGVGVILGGVPAALALLLAAVFGGARLVSDTGSAGDYLLRACLTPLFLAPAALSEEIMFRGAPLVLLARPMGRPAALGLTSVLFAMAHLTNPHVEPLAIANIALAGLFLGAAFYLPGGIWTAFGAHLGWNATLAAADAPVSGLPFTIPFINYQPGGPDWLTGAAFGPEGGLVATVVLALGLGWAARRIAREGT